MRHPYTRQLLQELDTEIVTKILKTDQNDIAAMTRIDPLGDDRSNVVYIVIMTKKEKGSHALTLKGLKVGNLSIIVEYSGASGVKTFAILHREILNYHAIQCPVALSQNAMCKISRFSFSQRTAANGRIAFRMGGLVVLGIIRFENRVSMDQKNQQT